MQETSQITNARNKNYEQRKLYGWQCTATYKRHVQLVKKMMQCVFCIIKENSKVCRNIYL
jgi:hypothetical protein